MIISRRSFCLAGGALVVSFPLALRAAGASDSAPPKLPGSLSKAPYLDAWIRIDADGVVSVYTGKAELGQGIKTALIQVAAEKLKVEPMRIRLITADTWLTADEQYTAGSHSLQDSGTAIRNAAAQVREILAAKAAAHWQLAPDRLRVDQGRIIADNGQTIEYGRLVEGEVLHVQAQPTSALTPANRLTQIGKSLPRVDIPAKVTGNAAYVHDMYLPGMVHARVVRPPSAGAALLDVDTREVSSMPGVLSVVQDGNYLAVIATEEFQSVQAMRRLEKLTRWKEQALLPPQNSLKAYLLSLPSQDAVVIDQGAAGESAPGILEATYTRAYQCHGSIGPSCAIALFDRGVMTVWTHSQGVYPNRSALAEMLDMPEHSIRCIHVEGSGCYGHNGADDAAADAALLARRLPGTPIRIQWTRQQEHLNEPYGPAMVTKVRAAVDSEGTITDWNYELWSNPHSTRPGRAAALLPAQLLSSPFPPNLPQVQITPEGSGDRNAVPLYTFPRKKVVWHFLREMPLRVSALRSLGAYMNIFSIESFMDELAAGARIDPVEFRLRQLDDERARAVVRLAADKFGWGKRSRQLHHGVGFAFARYKNLASYCAVACEVVAEPETGRIRLLNAVAAIDCGEIVNPDGIRNQTEGGVLQSMSWTLFEAVQFDRTRVTTSDWGAYPILRFADVPDSIEVHVIPRPGQPFLGAGEAAQGPTAGALANAVANAIGIRIRELPFTRERVKAACHELESRNQ